LEKEVSMKRKALMVLLVVSLVTLFAVSANAENRWGDFRVVSVGPHSGNTYILLRGIGDNPPFGERWCRPNAGQEKEMLAVALTAAANGMTVRGLIDIDTSAEAFTIHALYLMAP
jgi:hypothetical protein